MTCANAQNIELSKEKIEGEREGKKSQYWD
jgi:hypothetical protein